MLYLSFCRELLSCTLFYSMNADLPRVLVVFDQCFGRAYNTRLVGGFDEPEYLPAVGNISAEIRFRENFLASALHEVAHWCIAGPERRKRADFGYWYWPEGRDAERQLAFERAEVKPQALEWIFSNACGQPFYLSRDNHNGADVGGKFDFVAAVCAQAKNLCFGGLPVRAGTFAEALALEFTDNDYQNPDLYVADRLK